jgi:hypothetical protein
MNRFIIFFLFGLLLPIGKIQGQLKDDLYLQADVHHGYMLPEYQFVNYLVNDNIHSIEVMLSKKTSGKDFWQQLYRYPDYGLSLFLSTLGNNEVFGKQIALSSFYNIHLIDKKRFSLDYRLGLGLCYVTKKLDLEDDYQNIAIGSKLNIYFNFDFGYKVLVYKNIYFTNGLSFHHYSNGNLEEPNLGLNYLTVYAGTYFLIGRPSERKICEIPEFHRSNEYFAVYSVGFKHTRALSTKKYFTTSVSIEAKRKLAHKFHLGIGADLFYDSSTKIEMEALNKTNFRNQDRYQSGLHVSEEFVYNKFSLAVQEGVYLLLRDKVNNSFMYNRAIARYKVFNHFMVSFSMKSRLQILDYPELGFGVYW